MPDEKIDAIYKEIIAAIDKFLAVENIVVTDNDEVTAFAIDFARAGDNPADTIKAITASMEGLADVRKISKSLLLIILASLLNAEMRITLSGEEEPKKEPTITPEFAKRLGMGTPEEAIAKLQEMMTEEDDDDE